MKENKFNNPTSQVTYMCQKLHFNIMKLLDLHTQEELQLMSDYLKHQDPSFLQISLIDFINDELDFYKQMDLEDALEE
tara:strand:- start:1764 stop:1997 length:234 start_codon:yes stop_codon:yes gene_type:complete